MGRVTHFSGMGDFDVGLRFLEIFYGKTPFEEFWNISSEVLRKNLVFLRSSVYFGGLKHI